MSHCCLPSCWGKVAGLLSVRRKPQDHWITDVLRRTGKARMSVIPPTRYTAELCETLLGKVLMVKRETADRRQ